MPEPVGLAERMRSVRGATAIVEARAEDWLEARARGDHPRLAALGPQLDAAVRELSRAQNKLAATIKRLAKRDQNGEA